MPDSLNAPAVEWPGYAPEALERLRSTALDGLLALPRVGMGVGGLLLGTRASGRLRIVDFLPIPCGHVNGPAFSLSAEETAYALELVNSAGALAVIGCYFSKTKVQAPLGEYERALFDTLCPNAWQIMLLLHPSTVQPSTARLFYRDAARTLLPGPELDLDHLPKPAATVEPAVIVAPIAVPIRTPPLPPPVSKPAPVKPPQPQPPPARPRNWYPWVIPAAVLVSIAASGWVTRYHWLPHSPLKLDVTDAKGHVTFRWNTDAVRGVDRASLIVNDGGELHTFPLEGSRLEAGAMGYDRKSVRVTGTLRVGETRALASYVEPAKP